LKNSYHIYEESKEVKVYWM